MHRRLASDCETDGLLPELTKLHCLTITDLDTREPFDFADQPGFKPVHYGIEMLERADLIVGHNWIGFDHKAIKKVYPNWRPRAVVRDTIVLTRLMWPHIKESDFKRVEKGTLPKKLIGAHSLEAWGYRLGILKDEYKGGWEQWTPEMHSYMKQDGVVTVALWDRCAKEAEEWGVPIEDPCPPAGKDCIDLEHRVAQIVERVVDHGFKFNVDKAVALCAKLAARKQELEIELLEAFPPKVVSTTFIPKVNNKKLGYVKGDPFIKTKEVPFNPSSRQMIAERMTALGWKPQSFGKDGSPTVDDEVLQGLPYPQAKVLSEYFIVDKMLSMAANGKEAWLRHEKKGRIHGRIISGGAHTGRMTHSKPNMGQIPGCTDKKTGKPKPYGAESRECFEADAGMIQVGVDADALELRDLAGYMASWDGGAYIETVLRGDKSVGTDMHTINAKLLGCSRETAKTFFYALIYGSGDENLGNVLGVMGRTRAIAAGKRGREAIMRGVQALGKLVNAVNKRVETKGFLIGQDGRRLSARSKNAALNTLLQSAGAVQMKRALVILHDTLCEKGWEWGVHYAIMALVHDEWQSSVKPELADEYGQIAVEALRAAGRYYNFACPLDGQSKRGLNWKDTH